MAKDPVCGMFVEERPDSIRYSKDGREYYFCSKQCLNEFTQPEKELKKLKMHVTISIALTIPIVILSLPHMFPVQFGNLFPMQITHDYSSYIMLALATPLQFWIGWREGNVGPCKSFLVMGRLSLKKLNADNYRSSVVSKWRKRSPIYFEGCNGCPARGMCGNGCAYDAFVYTGDDMAIDSRHCEYTRWFHLQFIVDLFNQIRPAGKIEPYWWHIPSEKEREMLLGKVRAKPNSLSYSIGHQTSE